MKFTDDTNIIVKPDGKIKYRNPQNKKIEFKMVFISTNKDGHVNDMDVFYRRKLMHTYTNKKTQEKYQLEVWGRWYRYPQNQIMYEI